MNKSEQIGNLAAALVAAQAELKNPSLDSTNPHFKSKFASLANVRNVVTTTFAKHGLAIVQNLSSTDRGINCTTLIVHSSGEWMESDLVSIPATKMDAQGFGSAATYARRYSLSAFASVVGDDDDDGNAAAKQTEKAATEIKHQSVPKDAWDLLTPAEQKYLTDLSIPIKDEIRAGNMERAYELRMEVQFDEDRHDFQQAGFISLFSPPERTALTKYRESLKGTLKKAA